MEQNVNQIPDVVVSEGLIENQKVDDHFSGGFLETANTKETEQLSKILNG
jgi:hypothetical protein